MHTHRVRFIPAALSILLLLAGARSNAQSRVPSRVVLSLTADPAHSMAATWRTDAAVPMPRVEYAKATGWTDFAKHASAAAAAVEHVALDTKDSAAYYSAMMTALDPHAIYMYRVGSSGAWSEWHQFTTADDSSSPLTFVSFGDAQHGLSSSVPRVFRSAVQTAPSARFWLFTGDMTDQAEHDSQWSELFAAAAFIPATVPWKAAPGNHEYPDSAVDGRPANTLHPSFKYHFTFPRNGVRGMEEECYTFVYQGVRILVLNGNERLQEQALWLDSVLNANTSRWTIAAVHHPMYSMGKTRDQRKSRTAFLPVFDKFAVDLVLQGHDHVYARSARLKNGKRALPGESGTVYVTSQCGTDCYPLHRLHEPLMDKVGVNNQWFQVVTVDGRMLHYRSYTADGTQFDACELEK